MAKSGALSHNGITTDDSISDEDKVRAMVFANPFKEEGDGDVEEGWGTRILREDVELLHASPERVVFRFTVKPQHSNRLLNLHGGCTSTLFDWLTTAALAPIAKPGYWAYLGVSRTLNVTYIRPVPVNSSVLIECKVLHAGKRLCTIMGTMKRETEGGWEKGDGEVVAICEHGKVSIDPEVTKL